MNERIAMPRLLLLVTFICLIIAVVHVRAASPIRVALPIVRQVGTGNGLPTLTTAIATMEPTATLTASSTATVTNTPSPSPTLAPSATVTSTPTVTPVPVTLILNGNFEQGTVNWTANTEVIGSPPSGITAHSGISVARFSDVGSGQEIDTTITIPTAMPYLSYWIWIDSTETVCGRDVGGIGLVPSSGPNLTDKVNLCALNNTQGWLRRVLNVQSLAGQTVTLAVLTGTFDTTNNSQMYIDDIGSQSVP